MTPIPAPSSYPLSPIDPPFACHIRTLAQPAGNQTIINGNGDIPIGEDNVTEQDILIVKQLGEGFDHCCLAFICGYQDRPKSSVTPDPIPTKLILPSIKGIRRLVDNLHWASLPPPKGPSQGSKKFVCPNDFCRGGRNSKPADPPRPKTRWRYQLRYTPAN